MKRDWEIIRQILVRLEESETANSFVNMKSFPDFDSQTVGYNMRLLDEEKCIEAVVTDSFSGDGKIAAAFAKRLTHRGHDLLDTIRNDSVWKKIKDTFASKGLDMSVDLVIGVGKKIIESMLF